MIEQSLALAEQLQHQITQNISSNERAFHHKMQKLLNNPQNKAMLIELLDRSFRSKDIQTSFEFIQYILNKYGIADFFSSFEKFLLFLFINFGKFATNISVPFFIKHLRNDTKTMVLDADQSILASHIIKRKEQDNITLNINIIGEEVLGELESKCRIIKYEEALKSDYITYISIKITTIFSQINIIDFEYSKDEIVKRLDYLYAIAQEQEQKQGKPKFINLDMEEFRDLELTVDAFIESIAKFDLEAGVVLQSYIPDSYYYLKKLFKFSKNRVQNGMKPIKIRFVKGANMESEETIASQKGWALPTFSKKIDTDSNYNKMLSFVLQDDNYKYINIGIASHNIFEIAYAYTAINSVGALESFTFEMLEGMSLQCSYEISKIHNLILYAPVCDEAHFNNAIAYLVRRLDENTSQDNFMRYFFNLKVGDSSWEAQKKLFLDSLKGIEKLSNATRRIQDRNKEDMTLSSYETKEFRNECDTDFILSANRDWSKKIRTKYKNMQVMNIYPVINGEVKDDNLPKMDVFEKINNVKIGEVALAGESEIKKAIQVAQDSSFSEMSFDEIAKILAKCAKLMRERRGDLIGIAALEVGKPFLEIDPEVSEAIDFIEFYPYSLKKLIDENPKTVFKPKGIGVTIAPWNFPISISVGTIIAPLAAGNRVIYKPSSLSSLTGYMICKCLWEAGIPKDALIFLPSKGSDISKYLLTSSLVKFAILTGGEDTAYTILKSNPTLMLSAETGGKNATIVTKMSDRDQAVKNIIHSAFSNSGQKCSATSLLILEDEVYNDEDFKKTLVDAASSLMIGSPFDFKNKLGALAIKPDEKITKALNELESYEEWLIKPQFINNNPHLMTPGIKIGTREGDFTHMTELFAPILTIMHARDLYHAIDIVNSTGYGLTAGLESLDEREWEIFHNNIHAGNIYINKPTTGAIVLRQPFGGVGKSAIGLGRKVGIYNYITQFVNITQEELDVSSTQNKVINSELMEYLEKLYEFSNDIQKLKVKRAVYALQSYTYHYVNEFATSKDYVNIRGEDNFFSYTKVKNIAYRISHNDDLDDILGVIIAAKILDIKLYISYNSNPNMSFLREYLDLDSLKIEVAREKVSNFAAKIKDYERIRYFGEVSKDCPIYKAAASEAKIIANAKPIINGRFELLYYHNEKSLSISYHRYGNLGIRALKV